MKKYTSRAAKWLGILFLVSVVISITSIILIILNSPDIGLRIGIIIGGVTVSLLLLVCYLSEKDRSLAMDAHKIILPRGVYVNGKMAFKKTVVKMSKIKSVESKLHNGDGLISKDTFFHTLNLKDGTKVTVTLYAFGKKTEKEILETIQKSII